MTKLKSVKKAAALRKVTNLGPMTRNVTRWSSSFAMAKRYLDLLPFIDANDKQLKFLFRKLEQLDAVTKKLQDLSEAHVLFDHVMTMFPGLGHYLGTSHDTLSGFRNGHRQDNCRRNNY